MSRKKPKTPKTGPLSKPDAVSALLSGLTLNQRQLDFALNYVAGADGVRGNATKSAERAGYQGTGAALRVTGSRLLTHANVAEAIRRLQRAGAEQTRTTLLEWADLAPEAQQSLLNVMRGNVSFKQAAHVRGAANDVLERALGPVPKKVEHSGALTIDALLGETDGAS